MVDDIDPFELDRRLRAILKNTTRENLISSARAISDLGFGAHAAWHLVTKWVEKPAPPSPGETT